MTRKVSRLLLLALAAGFSLPLHAWDQVDKIVAVVGSKAILASELEFQAQMYAVQTGTKLDNPEETRKLKEQLLRQMIDDRLILIKAMQDTTIRVSDDEVDEGLNKQIEDLKARFGTEDQFEKQLEAEGYTFRELKAKLRDEIHERILKEKLISKLLSKISVTRSDVETFYQTYRDSLPDHPQSVKLAHLLLAISSSKATGDSLQAFAASLLGRISQGESFDSLAQLYSQDPSAESGGDIGTVRRGDLMPEFEKAALALSPGEVSGVVKSRLGYHIIKLMARTGDQYQARHILLLDKAAAADSLAIFNQAQSLTERIKKGEDFGTLVKEFSTDSTTRANFGELGWLAVDDLPQEVKGKIANVASGGMSEPVWSTDGLHIMRVLDRREARPFSLTEDWDLLKEYARRQKSQTVISSIVDEMKDKVYLELRDF